MLLRFERDTCINCWNVSSNFVYLSYKEGCCCYYCLLDGPACPMLGLDFHPLIEIIVVSLAALISHIVGVLLRLTLHDTLPICMISLHNTQLCTSGWCCTWDALWISCGNYNNFFISTSICYVISLFWANNASWVYNCKTPLFWTWVLFVCTS